MRSSIDSEASTCSIRTIHLFGHLSVFGLTLKVQYFKLKWLRIRGVAIRKKHIAINCNIFSLYCDILISLHFL